MHNPFTFYLKYDIPNQITLINSKKLIMNKNFIIILSSIAILSSSGCGVLNPSVAPTTTPSVPTASTTTPTVTINKENVATWPRFEFKELGFSIQLPFEALLVRSQYSECKNGDSYIKKSNDSSLVLDAKNGCDLRVNFSSFTASLLPDKQLFLASYSKHDVVTEEGDNPLYIQDYSRQKDKIIINGKAVFKPIKTIMVHQKEFVIVNPMENHLVRPEDQKYNPNISAIFNLENNPKFKAAGLSFREKDITLEQLVKALQTITF
jgi:hypothetical protein